MMEQIVKYLVVAAALLFILNLLERLCKITIEFIKDGLDEHKLIKTTKEYLKKKNKEEKKLVVNKFYGLFEIDIKKCDDELAIKKEYCLTIKDKIQSKYKNCGLQITATDKIFFNCSNFQIIDDIVDDLVKLFSFFVDINKKRKFLTTLRFSLWAKSGNNNTQEAYKLLSGINNLGFENQVMANDIIFKEYQKEGLKKMSFLPYGVVKLLENDEEIELFKLSKSPVAKSDDE